MNALNFFYRVCYHTSRLWSDKFFIRLQYRIIMGCWPNLEMPRTFNEKMQWLKLHDRKPIYTRKSQTFVTINA